MSPASEPRYRLSSAVDCVHHEKGRVFDFVMIDCEHGPSDFGGISFGGISAMLMVANSKAPEQALVPGYAFLGYRGVVLL